MASRKNIDTSFLPKVSAYYSEKLQQFGACAKGADWKNEESQDLRFRQLAKIIDIETAFSVNDLGCGYGAFLSFLTKEFSTFDYHGVDISEPMIEQAVKLFGNTRKRSFCVGKDLEVRSDFTVASGIFNVRLSTQAAEWKRYVISVLDRMAISSSRGFAFNVLTSYSDPDRLRENLYYADPCYYFDYCKQHYSRNVSLLHDYDLYEFTILVRNS